MKYTMKKDKDTFKHNSSAIIMHLKSFTIIS